MYITAIIIHVFQFLPICHVIFVCSENELFTEIGNEIIVSITIEAPLMSEFYIHNLICGRFIPTVHPRGHQFSEKIQLLLAISAYKHKHNNL